MGKTKCEEKSYEPSEKAKFECKKCGRIAKKENKLCKPRKKKDD